MIVSPLFGTDPETEGHERSTPVFPHRTLRSAITKLTGSELKDSEPKFSSEAKSENVGDSFEGDKCRLNKKRKRSDRLLQCQKDKDTEWKGIDELELTISDKSNNESAKEVPRAVNEVREKRFLRSESAAAVVDHIDRTDSVMEPEALQGTSGTGKSTYETSDEKGCALNRSAKSSSGFSNSKIRLHGQVVSAKILERTGKPKLLSQLQINDYICMKPTRSSSAPALTDRRTRNGHKVESKAVNNNNNIKASCRKAEKKSLHGQRSMLHYIQSLANSKSVAVRNNEKTEQQNYENSINKSQKRIRFKSEIHSSKAHSWVEGGKQGLEQKGMNFALPWLCFHCVIFLIVFDLCFEFNSNYYF